MAGTEIIKTRVAAALADDVFARASSLAMSAAEYLRHLIRRDLGFFRAPGELPPLLADMEVIRRRASLGDGLAQLETANRFYDISCAEPDEMSAREALGFAAAHASLAMEHEIPQAFATMALIQMRRAIWGRAAVEAGRAQPSGEADGLDALAMLNFNRAADRGDMIAEENIQRLSDSCSPEALRLAAQASRQ